MSEFFDPKTLSDEQLFTKHVELIKRRVIVARMGYSTVITQLETMIQAIENERRERMLVDIANQMPTTSVVIDTDPPGDEPEINHEHKKTPVIRPVRRPVRSKTPILPDGTQS